MSIVTTSESGGSAPSSSALAVHAVSDFDASADYKLDPVNVYDESRKSLGTVHSILALAAALELPDESSYQTPEIGEVPVVAEPPAVVEGVVQGTALE